MVAEQPVEGPDEWALFVADVYELAGRLRRDGERTAASVGQTQARWQLLSVVSSGDCTVPNAAERLGISRQAVQRIANELASDGLVEFVDNPRHRRSPFVRLSPDGHRVLRAIDVRGRQRHDRMLSELGDIDLPLVRAGVRQAIAALRRGDGAPDGADARA